MQCTAQMHFSSYYIIKQRCYLISFKMADVQLVLNSVLCFIANKFGKIDVKLLKSALLDFYDSDALFNC